MERIYSSIPKVESAATVYWACDCLSMPRCKLIHASKNGPWSSALVVLNLFMNIFACSIKSQPFDVASSRIPSSQKTSSSWSCSWLLMWLLASSPAHQQPWYRANFTNIFASVWSVCHPLESPRLCLTPLPLVQHVCVTELGHHCIDNGCSALFKSLSKSMLSHQSHSKEQT